MRLIIFTDYGNSLKNEFNCLTNLIFMHIFRLTYRLFDNYESCTIRRLKNLMQIIKKISKLLSTFSNLLLALITLLKESHKIYILILQNTFYLSTNIYRFILLEISLGNENFNGCHIISSIIT